MENSGLHSGLKEALAYAVESAKPLPETYEFDGHIYASEQLVYITDKHKKALKAPTLSVATLTGFIDYIKQNRDNVALADTFVQITGPASVRLVSVPNEDAERNVFIEAAAELPRISFGQWQDTETFIIGLQSMFADSEHKELLFKYAGNIKQDEEVAVADDGVSQRVTAKTGVATVHEVILPNPVKLAPYRTFQELRQPLSDFIFRVRKGGQCALFEADGGAWKVAARETIRAALIEALKDVEDVVIIG